MQQTIHPFPARMALAIALNQIKQLETGAVVLDPMMGSGTVIRAALDAGHYAIGRDVDPLAVLMSRVWTTPLDVQKLLEYAERLVEEGQSKKTQSLTLPWIDNDPETTIPSPKSDERSEVK